MAIDSAKYDRAELNYRYRLESANGGAPMLTGRIEVRED